MASADLHPAAGQQHVHGDVIGDALGQLDGGGIGERAGADLGQREADMLGGDDDVGRERQLEAATDGHAVERGDHRLVELEQFLQAAEATDAVIDIGSFAGFRLALFRSQPAEKNFSPPPVTMATRSSGSSRKLLKASPMALLVGTSRALAFGR